MNTFAYESILNLLDSSNTKYATFSHEPCKTSEESEAARAKAGYPGVVGAKALLTKLYFSEGERFATIVLPGNHVLNKDQLIAGVPGLKKLRFATPEEMTVLAGVVPGCMPPFASQIFPHIELLILASSIKDQSQLGFNAAYLDRSVVLSSKDYLSAVTPAFIVSCSQIKAYTDGV